jgi:hypothetical protein
MENYINENVDLKKRLENLEINNKNLLVQLQKMQSTLQQQQQQQQQTLKSEDTLLTTATDENNCGLNITSANQFGTLLMVLVLFFTVLLGVWSPVLTKDQITHCVASTAAAATAAAGSTGSTMGGASTTNSMTTTATAMAVASLAMASSVSASAAAVVKTESISDSDHLSNSECSSGGSSEAVANSAFLINNATNSLTARNKLGTTVELTKVRPFIRKLPTTFNSQQSLMTTNKINNSQTGLNANISEYYSIQENTDSSSLQIQTGWI